MSNVKHAQKELPFTLSENTLMVVKILTQVVLVTTISITLHYSENTRVVKTGKENDGETRVHLLVGLICF